MVRQRKATPSEFPPPVDSVKEFIKRELDPEDERIEVGVAIVGGGPAGLACANRLPVGALALQMTTEGAQMQDRLGVERWLNEGGHVATEAVIEREMAAGDDGPDEPMSPRDHDAGPALAGAPSDEPKRPTPRSPPRSARPPVP